MFSIAGAAGRVGVFREIFAGALAYFTFMPAIFFLVREPYRRNRFLRFHSAQSLLLWIAGVLVTIALKLTAMVLLLIPVAGPLMVVWITVVASLAGVLIWCVLVVKALQGNMFRLPLLCDIAERYASAGQ